MYLYDFKFFYNFNSVKLYYFQKWCELVHSLEYNKNNDKQKLPNFQVEG
jgi:hypothetical protein